MTDERRFTPARRRASFDEVADLYDRYRPSPPEVVVEALVELAGIEHNRRVLEIGCGTGQLSVALARRGADLVAVELGAELAALARERLSSFPNARVEVSAFEDWALPAEAFDAVVCANAFHWLDPTVRFEKCAAALCPGGSLAIVVVHHVRGGTPGFVADTQAAYVRWGLSEAPYEPPAPSALPPSYPELEDLEVFSAVHRRCFELALPRTTDEYVGWLRTDSLVSTLDDGARRGFLGDIEQLIDERYGGRVARNWVYELVVAERATAR